MLATSRRVVIKLGTQLLTHEDGGIDQRYLNTIARQICELRKRKIEFTLVASGAIGEGCDELDLPKRPKDVAALQAVAAIGQPRLMLHMHQAFAKRGLTPAQLLLTRSDFDDRLRFLNIRNCVMRLHRYGCVPIINENDTVAVEELEAMRVGENDTLAAMICNALRADALILLTVVEGLEDAHGQCIDLIDNVPQAMAMVRADQTRSGKGGMSTKLQAAQLVTGAGEIAVIANGRRKNILLRLFNGDPVGTIFVPSTRKLDSRSRWIAMTKRPAGTIIIDDGAVAALTHQGKSLLAIGVTSLTGRFERGEVVTVRDNQGRQIARGLTNYATDDLRLIMGKKTMQFEKLLGRPTFAEVVHRDNLILIESER